MIEHRGPNSTINVCLSIENMIPCRQVPSDDPPVTNSSDGVPSHPQITDLHTCVSDQLRVTGFKVKDYDYINRQPCS